MKFGDIKIGGFLLGQFLLGGQYSPRNYQQVCKSMGSKITSPLGWQLDLLWKHFAVDSVRYPFGSLRNA